MQSKTDDTEGIGNTCKIRVRIVSLHPSCVRNCESFDEVAKYPDDAAALQLLVNFLLNFIIANNMIDLLSYAVFRDY